MATSTVTINLRDGLNNPVAGVTPTFSATNTGTTNVNGACSASNASGVSTCTLSSTRAEVKALSIATPVTKLGGNVTFNAGPVSATTSTIAGTSPNLADGVDFADITVTLLDAFNNPIVATVPTFSATGTLNTPTACTSSNASGVSTCTLRSTKAEGKTIALVTPVAKAGSTLDFNPNGIDIQVPIDMISLGLLSTTAVLTFERSRTSLNTDDYIAQSNTYFFEVNAQNTNTTTAYTVSLINNAGVQISDSIITIPANSTVARRLRVEFTPTAGANIYRIRVSGTATASQVRINSARIIVEQDNATDTRVYIPLMANDESLDNATDNGNNGVVLRTTSTTIATSATYMSYWQRVDSNYDAIPPGTPWTFEALASIATSTASGFVRLYNRTSGLQVAQVAATGSTVPQLVSTSFASNATNFADNTAYEVRYNSSSTASNRIFKAGIWVRLKYLKRAETIWRLSMRRTTTTTGNYDAVEGRALYESAVWTNPQAFFQTVGQGTGCTQTLFNVSNTDSGTAGLTAVSGSAVTHGTAQAVLRSGAVTLVDNDRYIMRQATASGTCLMSSTYLVIRATE